MDFRRIQSMRWKKHHIEIKESVITVLCDPAFIASGRKGVVWFRKQIKNCIEQYPEFKSSHTPLPSPPDCHPVIQKMHTESQKAGVGPMAAVAGTVAEQCLESVLNAGASEAVVDNGGDIALFIHKSLNVGIYAGESFPLNLAFEIKPRSRPLGICTSSGTVGHSFSYGKADAAVVISENIILADAAATALANRVQSEDDLSSCFDFLTCLPEIEGSLVIWRDKISLWGKLPPIVKSKDARKLITRGRGG